MTGDEALERRRLSHEAWYASLPLGPERDRVRQSVAWDTAHSIPLTTALEVARRAWERRQAGQQEERARQDWLEMGRALGLELMR